MLEVLAPRSHFPPTCSSRIRPHKSSSPPQPPPPPQSSLPPRFAGSLRPLLLTAPPSTGARPPPTVHWCRAAGVDWSGDPAGVGSRRDEKAGILCADPGGIVAVLICIRPPRYTTAPPYPSFLQGDALGRRRLPPCFRMNAFSGGVSETNGNSVVSLVCCCVIPCSRKGLGTGYGWRVGTWGDA